MPTNNSKPIQKTCDDMMNLISDVLNGENTYGFNVDSVYCINGLYYVLEFLCCDSVSPAKSHPSRYWKKNRRKFLSLFELTQKLGGRFILVNYETSHTDFKVMELVKATEDGCETIGDKVMNREEFDVWFKSLNRHNYIELTAK